MIALLRKHIRKWSLELALAARNQAQAVVSMLESGEEGRAKKANPNLAPGAAKTANDGRPPAHWVQMVKRYAPELLQPGHASVALKARSQVHETDSEMGESAARDIQARSSSGAINVNDVPTQGDLTNSLGLPQLSKKHDHTSGGWQTRTRNEEKQTSGSFGSNEAVTKHPKHSRDDTETHATEATRAGSLNVDPLNSPAGVEKATQRPFWGVECYDLPAYRQGQGAKHRKAEISVVRGSAAEQIEKLVAGKNERKNVQADFGENFRSARHTGKDVVQSDPRPGDPQSGSKVDAGTLARREIDQETLNESRPQASESFKSRWSPSDSGVKTSPWDKRKMDSPGHVTEVRIYHGQSDASPLESEEKRSLTGELRWPSLPGEKDSEDSANSDVAPTWPSLPQKRSTFIKSDSNHMELDPSTMEPRAIECVRRLDEEQKGMPWNASHF